MYLALALAVTKVMFILLYKLQIAYDLVKAVLTARRLAIYTKMRPELHNPLLECFLSSADEPAIPSS